MSRLVIIGAGGYGLSIADIAMQLGSYSSVSFLDDTTGVDIEGICDSFISYIDEDTFFYPAFGSNALRSEWIKRLDEAGCQLASFVHLGAYVSPTCQIGRAVVIMPNAAVATGTCLEDGVIINIGAIVDHGCRVGRCSHIAPGAIVKAENNIPAFTKIESGEVVMNRVFPVGKK